MMTSLTTFIKIESIMSSISKQAGLQDSEKNSELMNSLKKIDLKKVISLVNLIVSSIDLESGRKQINVKSGIFEELDQLRKRYDELDTELGKRL